MSLNNAQEISSYLAMFFQLQWFYSESFACFLIYQIYIIEACYSTISFTCERFSHIWNKIEALLYLELKKCMNRIKPKQYPSLCSFTVQSATWYINHVAWQDGFSWGGERVQNSRAKHREHLISNCLHFTLRGVQWKHFCWGKNDIGRRTNSQVADP